jgi:hypothetical protein
MMMHLQNKGYVPNKHVLFNGAWQSEIIKSTCAKPIGKHGKIVALKYKLKRQPNYMQRKRLVSYVRYTRRQLNLTAFITIYSNEEVTRPNI